MPANHPIRRRSIVLLVSTVCLAAGTVAAFFGAFAGGVYELTAAMMTHSFMSSPNSYDPDAFARLLGEYRVFGRIGMIAGGAGGLAVGVLWCSMVIRPATRRRDADVVFRGCRMGVVAGLLATAILHVPLTYAVRYVPGNPHVTVIAIGVVCGILAGAILGAMCGVVCKWVVTRARGRADQPCSGEESAIGRLEHRTTDDDASRPFTATGS